MRLAMLFDNSGSLDQRANLKSRRRCISFGKVMRPMDEAAIYSIETDSYLAQPLTSDIGLLEQTIESLANRKVPLRCSMRIIDAALTCVLTAAGACW